MIRVIIVDDDGKTLSPKSLSTPEELLEAIVQAQRLIHACEQQAKVKDPKTATPPKRNIPYG